MTEPTTPARTPLVRSLLRVLLVPVLLAAVVGASVGGPGWIKIRRGDTLSELALKYGTSVEALRELNDLPGNNLIIAGQWLRIGKVPVVTKKATPAKLKRVVRVHTVRSGDGLIRIANKYDADWRWIARRNKVSGTVVYIGQRLIVRERFVRVTAAKKKSAPQYVSKEYARSLVAKHARLSGVPVSLALALAYNESGFQQHVRSSVGAVGVMQVMPTTGEWVGKYLVGRTLNLHNVHDNVLAGIRYFKLLLKITGRYDQALAGYYQGLASVRKRGMYDDTKAYVKNILALRTRFGG
ncbi:MAG TPA: LysM peptidoglycan-binding domain-containing protein [Frankiaceae bacterium]|nr:LysM peptidoglycan-binding domain-containing protein [Frankiaceae bacterium]